MKYDINELSSKLTKVDKELKEIEIEEKIKKYGTFLDSKKEIIQLYVLFIFFGIHGETIQNLPMNSMTEYSVD
tara:strand:+ start:3125 stop:3343 length:219 start_codon:yes stop_codon:yes gene_type:complete